jgi:glucosamine 6-phosphate synthetase-like amidotransferase/phosphosugar isomerase protein
MARRARLLVGHLRWATHGHPENNINNHPHPCDGGWLVHNGIVTNYESLCRRHQLWPVSECDSEALTLLIEQRTGTRLSRSVAAVEQSAGRCATLGLWSRPDTLVAVRRGNPLYASRAHGGIYMASCSDGLPGFAKSLPDCSAVSYRVTAGGVVETARKLKGADTIAAATGSLYCGG